MKSRLNRNEECFRCFLNRRPDVHFDQMNSAPDDECKINADDEAASRVVCLLLCLCLKEDELSP